MRSEEPVVISAPLSDKCVFPFSLSGRGRKDRQQGSMRNIFHMPPKENGHLAMQGLLVKHMKWEQEQDKAGERYFAL